MCSNFKEREEKRIKLKSFSDETVQLFVKFLYGYELEKVDINADPVGLAKDLIEMGGYYNVPSLQSAAATFLLEHITTENMLEIMDFVKAHNAEEAARICAECIGQKFSLATPLKVIEKYPEIAVNAIKELNKQSKNFNKN